MSDKIPMSEILAPAGDAECARAAVDAGADAIYLGYSSFSARASAKNFDKDALSDTVKFAHFSGVKVYVAMNTLVRDSELAAFLETLDEVWETGVDAIIMQDVFLGKYVHSVRPDIRLHLSTQAGVCNVYSARLSLECGFSRVILARETPIAEIKKISALTETEVFIQGALCSCFSGQCYFSSFAGGNSGNRGRCKQPCRKRYAYGRNGFDSLSYALSLSDLCVGERIRELAAAGVLSFKIEGRMRRPEYVASAVRYYRGILDGDSENELSSRLSDLKRAYNRGNYTAGLAFGQDKRFLSRSVQGHIGEKVGEIAGCIAGKNPADGFRYSVKSGFVPEPGDAFKILRRGTEAGGARFSRALGDGFEILSGARLKKGDEVYVTTDKAAARRAMSGKKRLPVSLSLDFTEGGYARVQIRKEDKEMTWTSEEILSPAKEFPLTEPELKSCFLKTDGLPLEIRFEQIRLGNVFCAKSRLNAFRRKIYGELYAAFTSSKRTSAPIPLPEISFPQPKADGGKRALIATASTLEKSLKSRNPDIVVFKPDDYAAPLPASFTRGKFEKYLYLPAWTTSADLQACGKMVSEYALDGVYAENYGGVIFIRENGCRLFAGTGFNLTNAVACAQLLKEPSLSRFALSKELNEREQEALSAENSFVLSGGGIKLMDLCYCPFDKTCADCDEKKVRRLTDEDGRVFSVRRFKGAAGDCRFELYNCADLEEFEPAKAGALVDRTLEELPEKTAGHRRKSML